MSTIKSSAENLTLNADGANNDVIIQSNGSTKVHIDGTGKVGIGVTSIGTNDAVHIENGESYLVMKDAQQMGIKLYGDDTNVIYSYDKTAGTMTGGVTWAHADGSTIFYTGGLNARMTIDSTGAVTMPAQPAFLAYVNTAQDNISVGTTHTIKFSGERFDNNADFNAGTYTFTAPVTGKYQFNAFVRADNIDQAASYYHLGLRTSNQDYLYIRGQNEFAGDTNYAMLAAISVLADMDAGDTAYLDVYQAGGTAQVDIQTSASSSSFSGYLVA